MFSLRLWTLTTSTHKRAQVYLTVEALNFKKYLKQKKIHLKM